MAFRTELHIEDSLPYYQLADPPVTIYIRVNQARASCSAHHVIGTSRLWIKTSENACTQVHAFFKTASLSGQDLAYGY
jgi:hypothetical protein